MKRFAELAGGREAVFVCTPDFAGRLVGKKRAAGEWASLSSEGMAMPDFHLVTNIENRPQEGLAAAGATQGFGNGRLVADESAAFLSPLLPGAVHVIADPVRTDGTRCPEAPREVLRRQLARLAELGLSARFASELEFYAFRQNHAEADARGYRDLSPIYHRHGDNDVLVTGVLSPFLDEIEANLTACGISVEQVQTEGGPGQIEINVGPRAPLEAADEHVAFKHVVKATAHRAGLAATFLAKPFAQEAGSGGHVHLSLQDAAGRNALGLSPDELTGPGRAFLAGLVRFTPDFTLLHAPYANSYRRLVPGAYTPLVSSWGVDNRTAMVRLVCGGSGVRLEMRLPGADANPYLCYAGIIAAGLAGIEAGLSTGAPKQGGADAPDAPALPGDLTEALHGWENSSAAIAAFPDPVHAHVAGHGRLELLATRRAVTDWEVARGFENA